MGEAGLEGAWGSFQAGKLGELGELPLHLFPGRLPPGQGEAEVLPLGEEVVLPGEEPGLLLRQGLEGLPELPRPFLQGPGPFRQGAGGL